MRHVEIVRIPARSSHRGVDELYYEIESDDWHDRAKRLQLRRWHHVQAALKGIRHANARHKERL